MQIQPYLFFEGRCAQALEFYRQALGAEVLMLMHYKDAPPPPPGADSNCPPGATPPPDAVMHAALRIGESTIMASDGMTSGKPNFGGFSLSIAARDNAHAAQLFDALAAGGQVGQPLQETFFAERFGMVTDRFGVGWMVLSGQKS
jgi:PhnB protein